ncbi:MAG TPA: hypothetical protein VN513_11255, partial [Gemmatimonadales bacterium]|nr:hypothetical protein [Gemmatimonadales bacterium]
MLDEKHVKRVVVRLFDERFELSLCLFGRGFRPGEPKSLGDALDVRVDGEGRTPEREEQHAGRSLRPHARQRSQPRT